MFFLDFVFAPDLLPTRSDTTVGTRTTERPPLRSLPPVLSLPPSAPHPPPRLSPIRSEPSRAGPCWQRRERNAAAPLRLPPRRAGPRRGGDAAPRGGMEGIGGTRPGPEGPREATAGLNGVRQGCPARWLQRGDVSGYARGDAAKLQKQGGEK